MDTSDKNEAEKTENSTNSKTHKSSPDSMFKETDYLPFMLGIFLIGGLIGMPLTYGASTGLGYFESLPWAFSSCMVFLIAFRRNGTISWGRAIPAFIAIIIVSIPSLVPSVTRLAIAYPSVLVALHPLK